MDWRLREGAVRLQSLDGNSPPPKWDPSEAPPRRWSSSGQPHASMSIAEYRVRRLEREQGVQRVASKA